MAQGKSRDPKRERFWRRHVQGQRASGLTIRDYCSGEALTESSFHFWRREIVSRDQQRDAANSTAAPAFVPVTEFVNEAGLAAWRFE